MPTTIIHTPFLENDARAIFLDAIPGELKQSGDYYSLRHEAPVTFESLDALRQQFSFDVNLSLIHI